MASDSLPAFPLIRHFSRRLTPLLLRLPLSANMVSILAMGCGLWSAWLLATGGAADPVWAAAWLILYYILDHCDGEVARAKNQASKYGAALDSFVDWLVHALLFAALGYGHAMLTDQPWWLWLGLIAAGGATINYMLALYFAHKDHSDSADEDVEASEHVQPQTLRMWFVFFFRELVRSDFCFLFFALAMFNGVWLLLPAAAIGAQVYWMMAFIREARSYHA